MDGGAVLTSAAGEALDRIATLCGCPHWEYPGQVVRDVIDLHSRATTAEATIESQAHALGQVAAHLVGVLQALGAGPVEEGEPVALARRALEVAEEHARWDADHKSIAGVHEVLRRAAIAAVPGAVTSSSVYDLAEGLRVLGRYRAAVAEAVGGPGCILADDVVIAKAENHRRRACEVSGEEKRLRHALSDALDERDAAYARVSELRQLRRPGAAEIPVVDLRGVTCG